MHPARPEMGGAAGVPEADPGECRDDPSSKRQPSASGRAPVPWSRPLARGVVRRWVLAVILGAYVVAVVAVTIFPITVRPASYWAAEPWWTMIHYLPFDVDAPSFVLNVIMFVP